MNEPLSIDIHVRELVRSLAKLGELRAGASPITSNEIARPLDINSVRALWLNEEGMSSNLPSVIVSSESALADLLPRMLALPGAVAPISSQMKTWLIEDVIERTAHGERPLSNTATLGFVGLIVGELKSTIGPDADLRLMGMDSVRRTLSFVCAQAAMNGWRHDKLGTIVERWVETSALTSNEVDVERLVPIADISGFLEAISAPGEQGSNTPQALALQIQFWIDAQDGYAQRDLLYRSLPQYARTVTGGSSREDRYDAVMEAFVSSKAPGGTRHPLELGFLISLIDPGSFDFLDLAKSIDFGNGAVAAAYCACAAILGKENTLSKFGGFGWNVVNHGLRFGIEMSMDISIAELRILHDARRAAPIAFRTRSPFLVDVELAPMVIGSFGNAARRKTTVHTADEESAEAERQELLRVNLATALQALETAYSVLQGRNPRSDRKAGSQRRQNK